MMAGYANRVFKAMVFEREYSPEGLQAILHIKLKDVAFPLNMLEKGGVIKKTAGGRLVKTRKYKTNQRNLF